MTISAGALQASLGSGGGVPGVLALDGGVLQSSITDSSPATFSYTIGSTSGTLQWKTGGGFAAGAGPLSLRLNNGTSTLTWGTTVGTNIVGTLKFGSSTAANVVTLQNGISLAGAVRTIQVDDDPNSTADWAVISGAIINGSGAGGITKTGPGLLILTGTNTYSGSTTISAGVLQVDEGVGLPAGSMLVLDGGVVKNNSGAAFTHSGLQWTANGGGFCAGSSPMTVNIGGSGATLNWGAGVGNGIMGPLKFGAAAPATASLSRTASISTAARGRSRSTAAAPR